MDPDDGGGELDHDPGLGPEEAMMTTRSRPEMPEMRALYVFAAALLVAALGLARLGEGE